jgi:diguanylate cyclase (GGDEF)-like protein/PAS domain S-box-containing protein
MKIRFSERKAIDLLVLVLVVLLLSSYFLFNKIQSSEILQKKTFIVLNKSEIFLSGLKDAETGQRGYMLTGSETYLEPYLIARSDVADQLIQLHQLTHDNPAQQKRLNKLASLVDIKLEELSQTIELNRKLRREDALKIVQSNYGKNVMDSIRTQIRDFDELEQQLLVEREAELITSIQRIIVLIFFLFVMLTIVSVSWIFERSRREKEFELRKYKDIIDSTDDAVISISPTGIIQSWNKSAEYMYGYTSQESIGQSIKFLMPVDRQNEESEILARIASGERVTHFETIRQRKDENLIDVSISISPIIDDAGNVIGASKIARDITERKQKEAKIHDFAFHDSLTNLPNRRLLDDRLEQAIAASKRSGHFGALMFLDLDNFKPLNDSHGHKSGDLLLIEVAHRLTKCIREIDTVARLGGDEFVVLLCDLNSIESECIEQAIIVAEKIRTIVSEPYWLTGAFSGTAKIILYENIGASIGVALFNQDSIADIVLKDADKAMYEAKDAGRNAIRFYEP